MEWHGSRWELHRQIHKNQGNLQMHCQPVRNQFALISILTSLKDYTK